MEAPRCVVHDGRRLPGKSAAINAAFREWIDAHQAYLVASGQVVPTAIRDAA
jgi:hypothetical protein